MAKGTLIALLLYIRISYASRIALSILLVLRTMLVTELRKLLDAYGQQQRPTDTRSVYYDAVLWLLFFGAHHASKCLDTQKWFIEQVVATSESLEMGRSPRDLYAVFLSGLDLSASFPRNLGSSFAYCSRMAYT